VFAYENNIWQ